MGQGPDQIRDDIERTRRDLGTDMDLLTEKVSPTRAVERNVNKAKRSAGSVKDRVMGSASDAASSVGDATTSAPSAIARKTEGNPLAAGVIAFGVGWLVSSLLPATSAERQAASAAKDKVGDLAEPVQEKLGDMASGMKDDLSDSARHSAQSVKETAQDAASTVGDKARQS